MKTRSLQDLYVILYLSKDKGGWKGVGWTKEFRSLVEEDDPVRHERLATIGKNGIQIRLHKKDDVLFRVLF